MQQETMVSFEPEITWGHGTVSLQWRRRPWRLKSLATRLFVQQFVQAKTINQSTALLGTHAIKDTIYLGFKKLNINLTYSRPWYLRYVATCHYNDVIMTTIASQITSLTIVYSTVYSCADQSKHQSSASLAFVWGIHQGLVNSPHKWPVTRKMFPFDDVIMLRRSVDCSLHICPGFMHSLLTEHRNGGLYPLNYEIKAQGAKKYYEICPLNWSITWNERPQNEYSLFGVSLQIYIHGW